MAPTCSIEVISSGGGARVTFAIVDAALPPLPLPSVDLAVEVWTRSVRIAQRGAYEPEQLGALADAIAEVAAGRGADTLHLGAFSPEELDFEVGPSASPRMPRLVVSVRDRHVDEPTIAAARVELVLDSSRPLVDWLRKISTPAYLEILVGADFDERAADEAWQVLRPEG